MAGDFNKPTIDDLYTAVFTLMRENMAEVAKMLDASTATNLPVGAKRWNATTKRFEKWSGSAWSELLAKATDSFDMRVAQSDDVLISAGVSAKTQGQIGGVPGSAVTNANSFLLSGTFFVSNAVAVTNWPTANVGGFLSIETTTDGNYIRQIFTDYNAAKWWVRVSSNAGVAWTAWKDINEYIHNHTLDSLSNALITANSAGEILKWNGSKWVNNTLAEAGIADAAHTHPVTGLPLTGGTLTGVLTLQRSQPHIVFADTEWGNRSVYADGGLIGFLSKAGGWVFHVNDGGAGTFTGNVSVGSAVLATDGNLYMPWAGDWISNILPNRVVRDQTINNVGSYAFCARVATTGILDTNGVYSGSELRWCGLNKDDSSNAIHIGVYSAAIGGTWRCLGFNGNTENRIKISLFQRIA